jgi:hypothetical protein
MGTKQQPGKFDCYDAAAPDEPLFILLARDASAPELVESWAMRRSNAIADGLKPETDRPMVAEALALASAMREWRSRNRRD